MTPQNRQRPSVRHRGPFEIREILLYGLPFWIAAPIIGWYVDGWLGLKSSLVGLLVLGVYAAGTVIATEKSQKSSAGQAVAFAVGGFWVRLIGLWILVYLMSRILALNLLFLLLTVAIGFTVILAISVRKWLQS